MDLTQPITYRGFLLNDPSIAITGGGGTGAGIGPGSTVENVTFDDVDVVQFLEKRSLQGGMDAGQPFLGARRIRMAGTLYALDRATLFDLYWQLRAALSSDLAFAEEPGDEGYRPLYFSVPTARLSDYPDAVIPLRLLAMPRAFQAPFQSSAHGGSEDDPLAIEWNATFIMKDPSIMAQDEQDYTFSATTSITGKTATASSDLINSTAHGLVAGDRVTFSAKTGGAGITLGVAYYVIASGLTTDVFKVSLTSGGATINITTDATGVAYVKTTTQTIDLINRGYSFAPLNGAWLVGPQAGVITLVAAGATARITVPSSTGDRIIRYKGVDKVLTVEEDSVELPRYDMLDMAQLETWASIPRGTTSAVVTFAGVVVDPSSHIWFWETYA